MGTVHRVAQLSSEELRRNLTHVQSHEVLPIMGIQVRIFSSLIDHFLNFSLFIFNSHLNGLRGTYMGEEVVYKVVSKKYKSLIEVLYLNLIRYFCILTF